MVYKTYSFYKVRKTAVVMNPAGCRELARDIISNGLEPGDFMDSEGP